MNDILFIEVFDLEEREQQASILVKQTGTINIIDGSSSRPKNSFCLTLFISCPRSDDNKNYVIQKKATEWYFPVWTMDELATCRKA